MHQDRNNGHWPELKRKKQRLSFDDEIESKPNAHKNYIANDNKGFTKTKKVNVRLDAFNEYEFGNYTED